MPRPKINDGLTKEERWRRKPANAKRYAAWRAKYIVRYMEKKKAKATAGK